MSRARDRVIAGAAVAVLVAVAGLVVWLVLDAQQAGIRARERSRLDQVQQLAKDLDTRVQQAYTSLSDVAGAPGRWTMRPRDPADAAKLQPTSPQATTGSLLVDRTGTIVNGSLLVDPTVIGRPFRSPGLANVLDGEASILPITSGLTTTHPVMNLALPTRATDGEVSGVYVLEIAVTADTPFSQEIGQLHAGRTGAFTVVDAGGLVAASTDEATLARPSDLPNAARQPGIHHRAGKVIAAAQIPSAHWILAFEQAKSEFQGDITRPLQGAMGAVALLVVVGGIASVIALLRRLRAAREEQRRLHEISIAREEFASIVSHELRTPVAGLVGFLQTTIDHWGAMHDDERRRAVGRALENANRLQHLSADVLDTSTIETGNASLLLEPLDLGSLVHDAADAMSAAYDQHRIEVRAEEPVLVTADAARLRQVISNVLDNAVKNSPPDSAVEIAVSRVDGQGRVAVHDQGTGIAVGDRERIFDKYTRAGAALGRGTGLGLYLARQIVQAHGGRIWVDDAESTGTTIMFTVPVVEGDRA